MKTYADGSSKTANYVDGRLTSGWKTTYPEGVEVDAAGVKTWSDSAIMEKIDTLIATHATASSG